MRINMKKPDHNYPYCHLAGRHLTIPVTTTHNIPWVELLFLTLRNSRLQSHMYILSIIHVHIIIHIHRPSCKVPAIYSARYIQCPLCVSASNETWIFPDRFPKNTRIWNFMKIRRVAAELFHVDIHTTVLTVALRNFANASKSWLRRRRACLNTTGHSDLQHWDNTVDVWRGHTVSVAKMAYFVLYNISYVTNL